MNNTSFIKLTCLLFCFAAFSCDAMNLKKLFCATQNIFKKEQVRKYNNNIEFLLKFYSDKLKYFKDDAVAAKAMKKLFKQSNFVQKRRFLRELDNYHIMADYRNEPYRLDITWTLYEIFADCMNDFNEVAQKNKTPLYQEIKVHSEKTKVWVNTLDGKKCIPCHSYSWKNHNDKHLVRLFITDPDYECDE